MVVAGGLTRRGEERRGEERRGEERRGGGEEMKRGAQQRGEERRGEEMRASSPMCIMYLCPVGAMSTSTYHL
jgi:hypothetical protein